MALRKRQRQSEGAGSSREQDYDRSRFVSFSMMALFNISLCTRKVIAERGFVVPNAYFERLVQQKGWVRFAIHPPASVGKVVQEFYVNVLHHRDHTCWVRGKWVSFSAEHIKNFYSLGAMDETQFQALRDNINWHDICKDLTNDQAHRNTTRKGELTWLSSSLLSLSAKI